MRVSVPHLRRGRYILTIVGDAQALTEEELSKCIPVKVAKVSKDGERFCIVELANPWTKEAMGKGTFDNDAVAIVATKEDVERERKRRKDRDEQRRSNRYAERLNAPEPIVAGLSEDVMADLPAGWPRLPAGVQL